MRNGTSNRPPRPGGFPDLWLALRLFSAPDSDYVHKRRASARDPRTSLHLRSTNPDADADPDADPDPDPDADPDADTDTDFVLPDDGFRELLRAWRVLCRR
jgi:hypothetical protein